MNQRDYVVMFGYGLFVPKPTRDAHSPGNVGIYFRL